MCHAEATLAQVRGNLDLSGPGAAKLATALRSARLLREYPLLRLYEMTVEGEVFSFYAVKEESGWKLGGL